MNLAHPDALSWFELAQRACRLAGADSTRVQASTIAQLDCAAPRPRFRARGSQRAVRLPRLHPALARDLHLRQEAEEQERAGAAAHYRHNGTDVNNGEDRHETHRHSGRGVLRRGDRTGARAGRL